MSTSPHPLRALFATAGIVSSALVLLAIAGRPSAEAGERYTLSGPEVAIYDLAGAVKLEAGSGSAVVVEVDRDGADAARLSVLTGTIGGRQTLRVRTPSDRVRYRGLSHGSNTNLRVRDDGTFGDDRDDDGHRVTISRDGGGLEAWADLTVSVPRGQQLTLRLAVGAVTASNVDGTLRIDTMNSAVSTSGTRGTLSVDTGSGEVTVLGAQGDVAVDTGSGPVEVSGIRGGRLSLDTGSGHVAVDDCKVDKLHADTGSGGVAVRALDSPNVDLDTGSGGIDVDVATDVESLVADTGSGHITLSVPPTLGATFELSSSSGGIKIEVPHETTYLDSDEARGRIGDGRGRIRLQSGSGSVRIRPRTSGGSSLLMLPEPMTGSTLE